MDSDLNQDLAAHCGAKTPLKDPGDQPPVLTKTKIVPLLFQCALGFHCCDELF